MRLIFNIAGILISIVIFSGNLSSAEKLRYSAFNYERLLSDEEITVVDSLTGKLGILVQDENSRTSTLYNLNNIPNNTTITKVVLYTENTNQISATYSVKISIAKLNPKTGDVVEGFDFLVPVGPDSSEQKTVSSSVSMKVNHEKYDYMAFIEMGDLNEQASNSGQINDPANVPIVNGFKIVYE